MKKIFYILLIFSVFIFTSCTNKTSPSPSPSPSSLPSDASEPSGQIFTLQESDKLQDDKYAGWLLSNDGKEIKVKTDNEVYTYKLTEKAITAIERLEIKINDAVVVNFSKDEKGERTALSLEKVV